MVPHSLFPCLAMLLMAATPTAWAAPPEPSDALQVLADLTLIDGACPNASVDFGVAFRFMALSGLPGLAAMPGGARRSEFEAVLRARTASFEPDELCGEIAENYAVALPGSVKVRAGASARP